MTCLLFKFWVDHVIT